MRLSIPMTALVVAILSVLIVLGGCTSLAFYEESKASIGMKVDPKSPDIFEVNAGFKEMVSALVPQRERKEEAVSIVSDFDVRYGDQVTTQQMKAADWLRAEIVHGLATGRAAKLLADRRIPPVDPTDWDRLKSAATFIDSKSVVDLRKAATALDAKPDESVKSDDEKEKLRRGLVQRLSHTRTKGDVDVICQKLTIAFPTEKPCG